MTNTRTSTIPARAQALAEGKSRYFGRVCAHHPELKGERRTKSNLCVRCYNERQSRRRKAQRAARHGEPRHQWVITVNCSERAVKSLAAELRARANLRSVKMKKI